MLSGEPHVKVQAEVTSIEFRASLAVYSGMQSKCEIFKTSFLNLPTHSVLSFLYYSTPKLPETSKYVLGFFVLVVVMEINAQSQNRWRSPCIISTFVPRWNSSRVKDYEIPR